MHGRPERARQRPRERATEGRRQRLRKGKGCVRLHKRKPRGPKRREPRLRWRVVRERAKVREALVSSCAQQRRPLQDDLAKRRSTAGALSRSSLALHGKRCVIWRVSSVACRGCMFDCVRAHRMSPWTCAPQRRPPRRERAARQVPRGALYSTRNLDATRIIAPRTAVKLGLAHVWDLVLVAPIARHRVHRQYRLRRARVGRIRSMRIATGGCEYPVSTW